MNLGRVRRVARQRAAAGDTASVAHDATRHPPHPELRVATGNATQLRDSSPISPQLSVLDDDDSRPASQ